MNSASHTTDAFDQWQSQLTEACGRFIARPPERHHFVGSIANKDCDGLSMAEIQTNATVSCKKIRADRDNDQYYFLIHQRSGYSTVAMDDCSFQVLPGDLLLLDPAVSCNIMPVGVIDHVSHCLDRHRVDRALAHQRQRFGKLSRAGTSGLLLSGMVAELDRHSHLGLADSQSDALQQAIVALLKPALQLEAPGTRIEHTVQDIYRWAEKVIMQSLADPALSPERVATQLNISVRHLYRAFEEHGDTICRLIQKSRLNRCAAELANPANMKKPITDIAYGWGFNDSAHFSRIFKKQFSLSPREYRQQSHLLHQR